MTFEHPSRAWVQLGSPRGAGGSHHRSRYTQPMTQASNQVLEAALKLSPDERAAVAAQLLVSLDGERDEDVEAAWAAEIERRVRRALRGEGEFEDWDDIRDQLRPTT